MSRSMLCHERTKLTILTINDVYEMEPEKNGVGGLASLATLLKQEKKKEKNVIITLNGDFLSASTLATKLQGSHMIDIFKRMPLDLVIMGNHEFDFGADVVRERIRESKDYFHWLNSNILDTKTNQVMEHTKRKMIYEFDGIKIGFFGVCLEETESLSRPGNTIKFASVLDTSKQMARELKEEDKVDVIIAITHLTVNKDRLLAQNVPEIDVILGGHDHTPHTQYQGKTFIHKSGQNANYVAKIDLHIEKIYTNFRGKIYDRVEVIPEWSMIVNRGYEPDKEIQARINYYNAMLPKDFNDVIAIVTKPFTSLFEKVRSQETAFGNLAADAVQQKFNVDLGLVNGGTLRGDKIYTMGYEFTNGDMEREMPFANRIFAVTIKGKDLRATIEHAVAKAEDKEGRFPHLSKGWNLRFNIEKKTYERIELLEFNGQPINDEQEYTIATSDYLLKGGDGFTALKNHQPLENPFNGMKISEVVSDFIKKRNVIDYQVEGRIIESTKLKRRMWYKFKAKWATLD